MAVKSASSFAGFEPLTANYLYCPNQFFDVCLPNCSRGAIRIVAFMLRETLGWLDKEGNPLKQEIKVTYRDLIEKAGVSRGAIGPALQEATQAGFIECSQDGQSNAAGQSATSAVYSLRWDRQSEYSRSITTFNGFYAGEGHRTPVPNRFFDSIIRNESLSVTKVVGTIIRHTIGYQNQFGGRRQEVPLSHQQIAKFSNLSYGKTLAAAIQTAVERGFIEVRQAGKFSHERQVRQATCYGIRWLYQTKKSDNGSEIPTETERFKKPNSNGSFFPAEERFKNPSSIKKTKLNNTLKQQTAAAVNHSITVQRLMDEGLDQPTALKLEESHGADVINRQIDWLAARNPDKNRLGMLRKAIEEDWEKPTTVEHRERQQMLREKDERKQESAQQEAAKVQAKKKERRRKKERLLREWGSGSVQERRQWLQAAVAAESSLMISEIIRRQSIETAKPHSHVLNIVAKERNLPCLF